ncbi:hypothetical protein Ahy_A08g040957 isoform B [Arachis hypogaea]|uniref:Uncharacterized protein n=1 Tax=Arachis hypogaea TaxID=3818 RepID=A0A445C148_ARAHY|nr:hypothetical protein Ahy_A08g040957 isoform B [Arachis hypogaea]
MKFLSNTLSLCAYLLMGILLEDVQMMK